MRQRLHCGKCLVAALTFFKLGEIMDNLKEQLMADISLREKYFEALIDIILEQQEALERISETISDHPLSFKSPSEGANVASDCLYSTAEKLKALGCENE